MKTKTVWCICHVDKKFYTTIKEDLKKQGYEGITPFVPTISILKKRFKGKDIYEQIPLLFSYGFVRMPISLAYSRTYLFKLKKQIPGIISWVKSLDSMYKSKKKKRTDNAEDWDDFSIVATITSKDIRKFKKLERDNKIYANDEITNIKPGKYIVLRGYPYEGVEGTVIDVSMLNRTVKMLLYPEGGKMEVNVDFDNVLYSIYHDHDPEKLHYSHNEDNEPKTETILSEGETIW